MTKIPTNFDWQGHRGCRGVLPENTVAAMLNALTYAHVRTLELDLAVSRDSQLIVSHEPWMSAEICTAPNGINAELGKKTKIFDLTYDQIKQFDCGSKGNARFPEQKPMSTYKPSLRDLVNEVKTFCEKNKRDLPFFNIEIKSQPDYDGVFSPPVDVFVKMVFEEMEALGITEKCCVQSFDTRACEAIHRENVGKNRVQIAFLVENTGGVPENLKKLTFRPDIYSCYFKLLRKSDIEALHAQQIRVVPWTVNNLTDMRRLIRWGVEGIITDYPNRIDSLLK
jgi:glycerophosphoryl diester phosphodiesterase